MTMNHAQFRDGRPNNSSGFSLVDLLLALCLGITLSGTILQVLISETGLGLRVNRLLRERSVQRRTLALIRDDVQRASRISTNPQLEQHACNLSGRLPVLHLSTANGPVTYSVGSAPSTIWRGQVLMRCGPAFDLTGQPSMNTTAQNRVVIDGLASKPDPSEMGSVPLDPTVAPAQELAGSASKPFSAWMTPNQSVLALRLCQDFPEKSGRKQAISSTTVISRTA